MGLFSRGNDGKSHPVAQLDEDITQPAAQTPGTLLQIKPYADNEGLDAAARLWKGLHTPETSGLRHKNVSDPIAFELWYEGETVTFHFHTPTAQATDTLTTKLEHCYPESLVHTVEANRFPAIESGDHVAAATLSLSTPTISTHCRIERLASTTIPTAISSERSQRERVRWSSKQCVALNRPDGRGMLATGGY